MRLQIMNYELRNICNFFAGLGIAGLSLASIVGCSEDNTAGVFTETESGQQASVNEDGEKVVNVNNCSTNTPVNLKKVGAGAPIETACINYDRDYTLTDVKGTVLDSNGVAVRNARVLLKRVDVKYSSLETNTKETSTDENGNYIFKDLVYKATYLNIPPDNQEYEMDEKGRPVVYYDYSLQVEANGAASASYSALNLKDAQKISEGKTVYREIEPQALSMTTSREIKIEGDYSAKDIVCLDYSFTCHTLTEEDIQKGFFLMENIPDGAYQNLCTATSCKPMDKPVVTKDAVGEISIAFPEDAAGMFDSTLTDKSLKNVLALISLEDEVSNPMLVNNSSLTKLTPSGNGTKRYWASVDFNTLDTARYNVVEGAGIGISSNIIFAGNAIQDSVLERPYMLANNTKQVGYSFKVKFDGSQEPDVLSLLKTDDESLSGFEIHQCEAKSKSICTRIRSGLDSVATDTTVYGKTEILDGEEHQFAIVFAGNHLTIAVNGKIIRDTDLKVENYFTNYLTMETAIGGVELKDFVEFTLDENIRLDGELTWDRLKAWLVAHQMLNK